MPLHSDRAAVEPACPGLSQGQRGRVVVAMSGGVDSSVVAALLAKAGHDVVGVTLQLYDHGAATGRRGSCCAGQDIHDARRVAAHIGIPHYVLDYEERFRRSVIEPFAASYAAGETPLPCVACNQQIKFGELLDTTADLGADVLATGHYVQRVDGPDGPMLARGADPDRDQSYFLFATTRAQLARLWFPIGHLPKDRVRQLAQEFDLPVAQKPDSQDICFVPSGHYSSVVERLNPAAAEPGDIVDAAGRVLGRHKGIMHFTVGQRRGLGLATADPLFVIRLDARRRQVVVGPRAALATRALVLREFNWLGDGIGLPSDGLPVAVRVRSSQAPVPATVVRDGTVSAQVVLAEAVPGVARGQACVLYADTSDQSRVLGGGIVADTVRDGTKQFAADAIASDNALHEEYAAGDAA